MNQMRKPTFDEETRALIYPDSALAAGSATCLSAMANKAKMQRMPGSKFPKTLCIVRFALATEVSGEAKPLLEALRDFSE